MGICLYWIAGSYQYLSFRRGFCSTLFLFYTLPFWGAIGIKQIVMNKKSETTAAVLAVIFGAIGILYVSISGFLVFLVINIAIGIGWLIGGREALPAMWLIALGYYALSLRFVINVVRGINASNKTLSESEKLEIGFKGVVDAVGMTLLLLFIIFFIYGGLSLSHII